MITSTYIVTIYLPGDQVLICKFCYYLLSQKLAKFTIFFSRNKGYVIPVDISHFLNLLDAVKFHMMYLFSSTLFNLQYHFMFVRSLVSSYSVASFIVFPLRDQTCLITLFIVAYKHLNSKLSFS